MKRGRVPYLLQAGLMTDSCDPLLFHRHPIDLVVYLYISLPRRPCYTWLHGACHRRCHVSPHLWLYIGLGNKLRYSRRRRSGKGSHDGDVLEPPLSLSRFCFCSLTGGNLLDLYCATAILELNNLPISLRDTLQQ